MSIVSSSLSGQHDENNGGVDPIDHWSATYLAAQALSKTKKVFIGGVSTSTTENELQTYFSEFGTVCLNFINVQM